MELASCHTSGDYNLAVAPRFLEILWALGVRNVNDIKR